MNAGLSGNESPRRNLGISGGIRPKGVRNDDHPLVTIEREGALGRQPNREGGNENSRRRAVDWAAEKTHQHSLVPSSHLLIQGGSDSAVQGDVRRNLLAVSPIPTGSI